MLIKSYYTSKMKIPAWESFQDYQLMVAILSSALLTSVGPVQRLIRYCKIFFVKHFPNNIEWWYDSTIYEETGSSSNVGVAQHYPYF